MSETLFLEGNTPDEIKQRMKENLKSDINTQEGGYVDTTFAPLAVELFRMYGNLETLPSKFWVNKDSGEWLDLAADALGITPRKQMEKAQVVLEITGNQDFSVSAETAVRTEDGLVFLTEKEMPIPESGVLNILAFAEQPGAKYNVSADTVTQLVASNPNIKKVTNPEPAKGGTNRESDTSLYLRIVTERQRPSHSGNKRDYEKWALEVSGVERVKVFPLFEGNGTVAVMIGDKNYQPVDDVIVEKCKTHIEDNRPIGATVTVLSAKSKNINILAQVSPEDGATLQQITLNFKENLSKYFGEVTFDDQLISYNKIGAILIDTSGVKDYSNLRVNGSTNNITLGEMEMPAIGEVVLE